MLKNITRCFLVVACGLGPCASMFAQEMAREIGRELARSHAGENSVDEGIDRTLGQDMPLDTLIVTKLRKANDAEIALSKMAEQRAATPAVKALAVQMVRDHQEMNQQLGQLLRGLTVNNQPSAVRGLSGEAADPEDLAEVSGTGGVTSTGGGAGQGGEAPGSRISRLNIPGNVGSGTGIAASGSAVGGKGQGGSALKANVSQGETAYSGNARAHTDESGLRTLGVSNPAALDAGPIGEGAARARETDGPSVAKARTRSEKALGLTLPVEYWRVVEQTLDNEFVMTRDMLSKHEGYEFDFAFLGQQYSAHVHTLAELRALESSGPVALRETASNAKTKVNEHLKEIIQTLASIKK